MNPEELEGKNDVPGLWERFKLAYQIDPKKYEKKGIWLYVGYLLLAAYFTVLLQFFKLILPWIHENVPCIFEKYEDKLTAAFGMFFINLIITIFYNVAMIIIHRVKHPFFERFRVNNIPWQWETNKEEWRKLLKKSIFFFITNNVIIGVPMSYLDSLDSRYLASMDDIPDLKTILWQFMLFLVVEDFLFYWFHRLFHHPKLYWIHKHHHEYRNTIAFAAQTAHPLEGITGSSIPLFLGFKVLSHFTGVHVISIWVFFTFRIIEGFDSHSGYEWGWGQAELIPFNSGSAYHSFHHSHNVGNFSSFFKFWDTLFGTNLEYIKFRKNYDKKSEKKSKPN